MATMLRPAPHFPDENQTFRSFSPLPTPSRPSLESSSMKSRKSFLNLLVPARRPRSGNPAPTSGSKLKQASEPAENMAINSASNVKADNTRSRDTQKKSADKQNAGDAGPTSKDFLQRPRSKSRTILRVISTTFRSRSPASPTSPPLPNKNLQAKENREAALRERGLLPPKPNKDLSRQEADQDRHVPIVPLDLKSADVSAEPSAADLIKQDWEAKNKAAQSPAAFEVEERERMKSFRFGVPSPSSSPTTPDFPRSTQLETLAEANTPLPSPLSDGTTVPPPIPMKDSLRIVPLLDPTSIPLPSSPLPTPPPTPSKPNASQKSASISSVTHQPPSSFHFAPRGDADSASNGTRHSRSGSQKSSSSVPPLTNPVIALTPPKDASSFGQTPSTTSLNTSIPHRRSESLTQLPSISESSSLVTPTLDTSRSPTISPTLNATDSSSAISGASSIGDHKGKIGLLKVKTAEHARTIPMIIESPVEDALVEEPEVIPEAIPLPLSPVSESHSPTLAVPQQHPVLTRRGRGLTDPGKQEKRKLFNPFKRGQSLGPDNSDARSRRISVTSSFGNLKRAASNFTRPRSSYDAASMAPSTLSGKAKTFDASHLPPSPTLPSHFMNPRASASSPNVGLKPPNRKALEPTLHNRASIMMEMNAIKDDEVRRMTEVAFLG
ncbi:hypothetical protein AN958_12492 [Leucoagaricus sp. SymC.cos]|nr:hypothetical protein AN958_12492 [Leucoagaricus sp. SymC.cos]